MILSASLKTLVCTFSFSFSLILQELRVRANRNKHITENAKEGMVFFMSFV
jgi:hypothetical protein